MNKSIKVLTFGTFDILHQGHEFYLKQAKEYGDILGVVIARDKNVAKIKGKYPINNELKRLNKIKVLSYVNQVFLGNTQDKYKVIEEFKPDVICLGYDQRISSSDLEAILNKRGFLGVKIIKFEKGFKTDIYKSSKLKKH